MSCLRWRGIKSVREARSKVAWSRGGNYAPMGVRLVLLMLEDLGGQSRCWCSTL